METTQTCTHKSIVNVVASVCVCSVIFCEDTVLFGRFKGDHGRLLHLSYSGSDILSVTHVLGYNIAIFGSVLHSFECEKQGEFFIFFITKKS